MEPADILTFFVNSFFILFLMTGAILFRFRDPKNPLNRSFYNFYLYFSLGLLINIIYRSLNTDLWKAYLGRITIAAIIFSFIFLLQFNLILLNKEMFYRKRRWIIVIVWLLLCSVILFIDWNNGTSWEITAEFQTGVPYWSTTFTIYTLTLSLIVILVTVFISTITRVKIDSTQSKAKHLTKNLAILFFSWALISNILNNWVLIRENAAWFSVFYSYSMFIGFPAVILFWFSAITKVE